jgi:hypothetical protein
LAGALLFVGLSGCLEPLEHNYSEGRKQPPQMRALPARNPEVIVSADGYAKLGGEVKSWLTQEPVQGAALATVGMDPPATTTSAGPSGAYNMDVLIAGVFWMKASKEGYLSTYEYVRMPQGAYPNKGLYVVDEARLDQVAQAHGKTRSPSCGTVLVEVKNPLGQGQRDIAGVRLSGMAYEGPYFLGPQNQSAPERTFTSESGRVVFFNVCDTGGTRASPGASAQLTIDEPGVPAPPTAYLNVYAGGATRGVITVDADVPPAPDLPAAGLVFTDHIYPIFVREACASCHAHGGQAAATGLYFNGAPREVYDLLRQGSQRVTLQSPSASLLLSKPLYEEPPNHPNASFPSTEHPEYRALYTWIQEGATYDGEASTSSLPTNVSFSTDVYPRFGALSCNTCHNSALAEGGVDLTGTPQVVYDNLMAGSVVPGSYQSSTLYTRPNTDYPEQPHAGIKPVTGAEHEYARSVAGWIYEGASY